MRAAVHTRYGPPSRIQLQDIPKPAPGDGDLLVKVHATTVNRTDCGFLRARPAIVRLFSGLLRPKARILGSEFSGVVEAVGSRVSAFRPGDSVFGLTGDVAFGAHAEHLRVPADGSVAAKPEGLTHAEAASVCDGAHLAQTYLRAVDAAPGRRALINGASGSIGAAAVQLFKHAGLHVTAVSGSAGMDTVRALGADEVLDYTRQDFTRLGRTFDIVFDAVGKSAYGRCRPLLGPGAVFLSTELGPWGQNPLLALWSWLSGTGRVKFPLPSHNQEDIMYFKGLLESGALKPVIDRRYPLERIVEAFSYVETERKVGNVVIEL